MGNPDGADGPRWDHSAQRIGGADDDRSVRLGGAVPEQRIARGATRIACRATTSFPPLFGRRSEADGHRPERGCAPRAGPAEGRAYGGARQGAYGEGPPKRTTTSRPLTA